jgi:hypothetical protein
MESRRAVFRAPSGGNWGSDRRPEMLRSLETVTGVDGPASERGLDRLGSLPVGSRQMTPTVNQARLPQ